MGSTSRPFCVFVCEGVILLCVRVKRQNASLLFRKMHETCRPSVIGSRFHAWNCHPPSLGHACSPSARPAAPTRAQKWPGSTGRRPPLVTIQTGVLSAMPETEAAWLTLDIEDFFDMSNQLVGQESAEDNAGQLGLPSDEGAYVRQSSPGLWGLPCWTSRDLAVVARTTSEPFVEASAQWPAGRDLQLHQQVHQRVELHPTTIASPWACPRAVMPSIVGLELVGAMSTDAISIATEIAFLDGLEDASETSSDAEKKKMKKKRKRTVGTTSLLHACSHCRAAKVACGDERPCKRCTQRGFECGSESNQQRKRACRACNRAKTNCDAHEGPGSCSRCKRLNVECVPAVGERAASSIVTRS